MTKYQKYYRKHQEIVREQAIDWQCRLYCGHYDADTLWIEPEMREHFTKLGKRFGLTREFRENAII